MNAALVESLFAALALLVCATLGLRLLLSERRRYRFDMAMHRTGRALRSAALRLWHLPATLRGRREAKRRAAQAAVDAIRRASGRGEWDGNVYRPKSFRKPPRDKMH